ncbi:MAG: Hsp20/alpha crystallin family protein [Chromatiales bacterium]|jgi:HSP20 family protein
MFGDLTTYPGSLFEDFERMRREMNQMFDPWVTPSSVRAVARGSFPAVNVGMGPETVDVYVFAPGADPAAIDVSIERNILTVTGNREGAIPEDEGTSVYLNERFSGPFRRALALPDDVDPEQVQARYTDGVLHVSVRRKAEAQPRRIEVR